MNPFAGWSKEDVERHNARVAEKNRISHFVKRSEPEMAKPSIDVKRKEHPAKRIRQSSRALLNKLETAWLTVLQERYPDTTIHCQAKKYRICNGSNYTPDFTATINGRETAWEVKGRFAWEDSLLKIKMAASVWKEVEWWLVWKDKTGKWTEQLVLP